MLLSDTFPTIEYGKMNVFRRNKLTVIFVLALVLFGACIILANSHFIRDRSFREARERVQNELTTAQRVFEHEQKEFQSILTHIILTHNLFTEPFTETGQETILSLLNRELGEQPLDVLSLTDGKGATIAGVFNPELFQDMVHDNAVIAGILETGKPAYGIQLVSSENFRGKARILSNNVSNGSGAGQAADAKDHAVELPGLMIVAGVPVMNKEGALTGILAGGRLIINERAFRDNSVAGDINRIIFGNERYKGEEIGMTAFSIRDSSLPITFRNRNGKIIRQTDTINEDFEQVVGHEVIDNNRYVAGYDYIRDIRGEVVGMIGVGIREDVFTEKARYRMFIFSGVTGIILFFSLFVVIIISRKGKDSFHEHVNSVRRNIEEHFGYKFKNDPAIDPEEITEACKYVLSLIKARDKKCKKLTQQVREGRRLATLGQLAAGVAHEINNPLTGIIVYSHLLLEDTDKNDPRCSNIKKVIRESHRCKNIVRSILDFARQSQPSLEPLEVNKIIIEALNNIRREAICEHIEIREKLGKKLPVVYADSSQIQQVFANIIRNAFEIMDDSGKLTITSRFIRNDEGKEMIEILFEDTGPGISPEHLERIFDPFFTTKTKVHGTGLGLAVCYGIIERHGGTITVRNREEGGALFSVCLPVKEESL